jgi:hypothetical protein
VDGWLVINNIFERHNQVFIVEGRGGHHVFAYNYVQSYTNSTVARIAEMGGHKSHPEYTLWEGNVAWTILMDSIHGSASHAHIFRNNWRGWGPESTWGQLFVGIDHTNYFNSIVGNVMGYSGISTSGYPFRLEAYSSGDSGDRPDGISEYLWGYSGNHSWTTNYECRETTTVHGNYDYPRASNHWDSGIADHAIPNSLVYASKPSWFGFLTWPPISNDNPDYSSSITNIPAGWRYTFGSDPPPEVTGGRLNVTTIRVGTLKGK